MEFDIIEVSDDELKNYTAVQMQLLRTAQKNKNKLAVNLEKDKQMYKQIFLTNDAFNSTLYEDKCSELDKNYEYEVEILVEQLNYALELNSPIIDDEDLEKVGYVVDYSLSYSERYYIVRDYYLSIEDPSLRMSLYANDEVAKRYLDSYYVPLFNTLSTYSK